MNVLLAEDDSSSALILRRTLEKLGHEVTVASDGFEAWAHLQEKAFPLVISDWMMPKMDGPTLCRRIRERAVFPYTYVILLTTRADRQDRLEGLASGADDFLAKPLGQGELFARLEIAQRLLKMQHEMKLLATRQEEQNAHLTETLEYLEIANHRFSELFDGLPVACYSCDDAGIIHEWNRAAVALFGYRPEEVCQRPAWEVFRGEALPEEEIRRVMAGESLTNRETEVRDRAGRTRHLVSSTIPVRTADGRITGLITAGTDITGRRTLEKQVAEQLETVTRLNRELECANARLAELATTDGLTGLKNHRHFQETLHAGHAFAARQKLPLSLVMLDVDFFKKYNDSFGHPAGDAVLRQVAALLRDSLRIHDVLARYGGEEFVALLPATGRDEALLVAERLRASIAGFDWPLRPVTASFGVATFDPATPAWSTPGMLVDAADAALYHAKEAGRDRVRHADALPVGHRL